MEMEFTFPLIESRRNDLMWTFQFYAWWLHNQQTNLPEAEAAIAQALKVEKAPLGELYRQTYPEFVLLYRAAQYTIKGLSTEVGDQYMEEMIGDAKPADWQAGQRHYLIKTCMISKMRCEWDKHCRLGMFIYKSGNSLSKGMFIGQRTKLFLTMGCRLM
jgi:hypothetical protein